MLNSKKILICISLALIVISLYLGVELHNLKDKLVSLEREHQKMHLTIPPSPSWPEGIAKEEMIDQLAKRSDIFPWRGVLGGTMGIYDQNLVWFIGPSWCLAYIEDGHIGGYILLRYEITPRGIEWQLLDSEQI